MIVDHCSFCGRHKWYVDMLYTGVSGAAICSMCIARNLRKVVGDITDRRVWIERARLGELSEIGSSGFYDVVDSFYDWTDMRDVWWGDENPFVA